MKSPDENYEYMKSLKTNVLGSFSCNICFERKGKCLFCLLSMTTTVIENRHIKRIKIKKSNKLQKREIFKILIIRKIRVHIIIMRKNCKQLKSLSRRESADPDSIIPDARKKARNQVTTAQQSTEVFPFDQKQKT